MLLFLDGFDHYVTADIAKKWDINSGYTIAAGNGRRSTASFRSAGHANYAQKNLPALKNALIVGGAWNVTTFHASGNILMQFCSSAIINVSIAVQADGRLQAYRGNLGGTLLGQSAPGIIAGSTWYFIEAKAVRSDTVGAVEIRVNGVAVLTLSSIDTNNGATEDFSNVVVGATSLAFYGDLDDFYIADTTGTANADFLGDVRIDTFLPTSDGAATAWTPTPGGTHYTTVDEAAPSASDYVASSTSGQQDLYGFADLAHTPLAVYGVQLNLAAQKSDAGARGVKGLARIGSTVYASGDLGLSETLTYRRAMWDTNPAGGSWTDAAVNAAQFGAETV